MKHLLIIIIILLSIKSFSQESSKVLLIFKNNSKVYYWNKVDKKKHSGIIKSINNEQMIINDTVVIKIADLEKLKFQKAKYFVEGKRVDYLCHTDEKKTKGKLISISDSSIVVSDKNIALNSISRIGGRAASLFVVKIIGGAIMSGGGGVTYIGLSLISESANSNDCGAPIVMVAGIAATAVGVAGIIAGSVPLFFSNKHYDIGFEWTPVVLNQKFN